MWGLKPKEVKALTLREYSLMELAMFQKKNEAQAMLRQVGYYIINFGGMGVKKMVTPEEIISLPYIDNENLILPIRSIEEALKLLAEFE